MKNNINEQQQSSISLEDALNVYKCKFVNGGTIKTVTQYGNEPVIVKTATKDAQNTESFKAGDTLVIKKDFTFDFYRDNKYVNKGTWKCSTMGVDAKKPQLSVSQQKSIDDLVASYKGMYQVEEPAADLIKSKEYEKVNLNTEFPEKFGFDYFIWKKIGKRQTKTPQQENIIKTYTDKGYLDLGGSINPANKSLYVDPAIDLQTKYPNDFTKPYYIYYPLSQVNTKAVQREMQNLTTRGDLGDRKTCKSIIKNYNTLAMKNAPVDDATLETYKVAVNTCKSNVSNFNDLGSTKKVLNKLETETEGRWSLSKPTQKESHLNLKKIVRENLVNKLKDKKVISEENNIVKSRFSLISEEYNIKTKKGKENFSKELFVEMVSLRNQGFDGNVINEQLVDMIKSLFGNAPDAIMGYFKEYAAKLIINKLGITDSWFTGVITKAIGNIHFNEIGKLTDCNFVSKLISKSVVEEMIDRMKNKAGLSGALSDILRNSVMETIEDTAFGTKVEEAIGGFICPVWGKLTSKMGDVVDKTKEKTLQITQ